MLLEHESTRALRAVQERLLAALALSATDQVKINQLGGDDLLAAFQHCQRCRGD